VAAGRGNRQNPVSSISTVPDPLTRLGRVIALLARSGDPDAIWAAEALVGWRDGSESFEEVLGGAPGLRAAWHRRQWDRALGALAQRFPAARSARALAAEVHPAVSRYEAGPWLRDKAAGRRPDGINGLCYDLLSHGELPGEDRLRRLLKSVGYWGAGDTPPGLADSKLSLQRRSQCDSEAS
jgi:hypothetical protein